MSGSRPPFIWLAFITSTLVGVSIIAVMFVMHKLTGLSFVPYDLLEAAIEVNLLNSRNLLTSPDTNIAFPVIGWMAVLVFWLLIVTAGLLLLVVLRKNYVRPGLMPVLAAAALLDFPMLAISFASDATDSAGFSPVLTILWHSIVALIWAGGIIRGYRQIDDWHLPRPAEPQESEAAPSINRRQFLRLIGGGTIALLAASAGILTRLQKRTSFLEARLAAAGFLPPFLKAKIFPSGVTFIYPEQAYERFNPASRPFGVCFPGGGARAAACAIGQTRGLMELGLLREVGAISCVSGGAVFGAMLNFASEEIELSTLLGQIRQPGDITLENLAEVDPQYLGTVWTTMTSDAIGNIVSELLETGEVNSSDRLYTYILRRLVLSPFGLDRLDKFIAQNSAEVSRILDQNAGLQLENFYIARPDLPFFIAGLTHIYPTGRDQAMRHFEITPMITGTPQRFIGEAPGGIDFGGGYLDTFAFNSVQPTPPDEDNVVQVETPDPIFSLSDLLASASAAPGLFFDLYGVPNLLPNFYYWPLVNVGRETGVRQSFTDGAALENFGIIPLLRRHYPIILFFVNTNFPLADPNPNAIGGMDSRIGRLFGLYPDDDENSYDDLQVFPTDRFDALSTAMLAAKEAGEFPIYVDSYPIVQPNAFDIPAYPGDGEVTIVWMYNDLNINWEAQLPDEVRDLLNSSDPTNLMTGFPHLKTIGQNTSASGVLEIMQLSAEQINLLAHMWCYTITEDAADLLLNLRDSYHQAGDDK